MPPRPRRRPPKTRVSELAVSTGTIPPQQKGSGGLVVPAEMRRLMNGPGSLPPELARQLLRMMYQKNAAKLDPESLSDFALRCFLGDVRRVRQMVENGSAPDLLATETAFEYGYAMFTVSGAQRIVGGPPGVIVDHPGVLRYLLEIGMPPDLPDILGYTALQLTCMARVRADLVRVLLECGADPDHQDRFGGVAIMSAFQNNAVDAIDALMEFGASLDIPDADGCTPEEFYVKAGPQVTATVHKWKRRRSGEAAALDGKGCGFCGKSEMLLKFCAHCHVIRYCTRECQRAHWPVHKLRCIPFSPESTVTVTPFYEDIGPMTSMSNLARESFGIPVETEPERNTRSVHIPNIPHGQTKLFIIKIQVPFDATNGTPAREEEGDMMVFDKKRSLVCRLRREDDEHAYLRISRTIRACGVFGAKAYFAAEMPSKDMLVIKITEPLAEQDF
ncbi:ankyrin [Polyporus arcularius HHB13444]|uniref:Ankyrin n=1 Tax=Polyporus arcularius HHB13444 TaxID=1314778 RepID=A0A5C3P8F8_9APHY|nr:ankyrin [Polyporus arcularius HHB13444]